MAGNLGIDLVNLPAGYSSEDIVGVQPHQGRERSRDEGYRHINEFASVEYARQPGVSTNLQMQRNGAAIKPSIFQGLFWRGRGQ